MQDNRDVSLDQCSGDIRKREIGTHCRTQCARRRDLRALEMRKQRLVDVHLEDKRGVN